MSAVRAPAPGRRAPAAGPGAAPRRVVLVHDYLTQCGGAERVVSALAGHWPEAEIRVLLFDPAGTFEVFSRRSVRTSPLQPLRRTIPLRAMLPLMPAACRSLRVREADLVVSSSSGWGHAVRVPPGVPHICYCHTPPHWLYDSDAYLEALGRGGRALAPLLAALRRWDQAAARRPTRYVANSENVRRRIARVYGRPADVLHPPVDTERFAPAPPRPGGYVLSLGRLLRYKRVDLAIDACRMLGVPLVVAGDGPDRRRLQARAGRGVRFAGRVADAELPGLLAGCSLLFMGGEEDFGITPLEANAGGRPVVALGRGGALETVRDGETGMLFPEPTAPAAARAIRAALEREWSAAALTAHAAGFGRERFLAGLDAIVADELSRAAAR